MINIFYGNTLESCSESILSTLSNKEKGRSAVVLAPDSYLFAFENKVAEMGYSLDIEVMSFSALARTVLKNTINRCLTPEGCNMIMARAIREIKDELVYYKKSVSRKGFVNEMYSTVTALRNSGISPTDLANGLSSMHGYVANKTRDLITIYNAYLKTLSERYSDPTTRLEALLKAMPNNQFIKETEFYIVDFYTFNHKEYEVLGGLFKYAYSVNIGIIDAVGGLSPKSIYPLDNTDMILHLADKSGSAVKRINAYTALDEYGRFVSNDMFGLGRIAKIQPNIDMELINPLTVTDEADTVCMKISELVRKGVRYRDIGIVCGNPEDKTLESYLSDYEIPYFKDIKNPLTEEASIKYLLFALDAVLNNLEINKVMSLIKNPLSSISPKDGMIFENYAIKYGINYSRFREPFTLGKENEITIPEKVRIKLMEQIGEFPQNATVSDYVSLTRDYLTKINYQKRLERFFDKQHFFNDMSGMKRTVQIPVKLVSTLNLCGEILSDYQLSLSEYIDILENSFESIKLALIPLYADAVQVGEARDSKFEDIKYLFVVGATDGQIPKESGEGTILTDKYSTDLQLLNMVVRPRVKEENRFGKFAFSQVLLKATKGLYISCPVVNGNGDETTRSAIFEKFKECFSLPIKKTYTCEEFSPFVTKKQCLKKVVSAISQSTGEISDFYCSVLSLLNPEDKDRIFALYYNRDNTLEDGEVFKTYDEMTSVSRIETFNACPYLYFIRYGLGAKEREVAEVKVNETGNFIHEVLEVYFAENGGIIDAISYDVALAKAREIADKVLAENERLKSLASESPRRIDNLKKEASFITAKLNELVKQSKLRPFLTEAAFGYDEEGSFPCIKLSSGTMVRGKIDRVDIYNPKTEINEDNETKSEGHEESEGNETVSENKECNGELNNESKYDKAIVVIDYKTGNVKPELKEIFFGEKIQLYVYLYVLRSLGFKPIGAFYQHIDAKYTKQQLKYPYLGQFINTTEVLDIIDPDFKVKGTSEILPIKFEKGKCSSADSSLISASNMLLSEEEFEDVLEYAYRLLEKSDENIRKGYIQPKPFKDKCIYCNAKNICAIKNNEHRKTKSISKDFFKVNKDETVDD